MICLSCFITIQIWLKDLFRHENMLFNSDMEGLHGWYLMIYSSATCIIGIKFCDDYDCHWQLNEDTFLK